MRREREREKKRESNSSRKTVICDLMVLWPHTPRFPHGRGNCHRIAAPPQHGSFGTSGIPVDSVHIRRMSCVERECVCEREREKLEFLAI